VAASSFPWNATNNDRAYDAGDFQRTFGSIVERGGVVRYGDNYGLVPSASGQMIRIAPGAAWPKTAIRAACLVNDSDLDLQPLPWDPALGLSQRIDAITVRYDADARDINIMIIKGGAAAPAPVRNDTVFDLVIGHAVMTSAGLQSVIDTTADQNICGAAMLLDKSQLPVTVAKGGTGASTAAQARANLGAAAAQHGHDAGQITSGVLPIAHGGLGTGSLPTGLLYSDGTTLHTIAGSGSGLELFTFDGANYSFREPIQSLSSSLDRGSLYGTPGGGCSAADLMTPAKLKALQTGVYWIPDGAGQGLPITSYLVSNTIPPVASINGQDVLNNLYVAASLTIYKNEDVGVAILLCASPTTAYRYMYAVRPGGSILAWLRV